MNELPHVRRNGPKTVDRKYLFAELEIRRESPKSWTSP